MSPDAGATDASAKAASICSSQDQHEEDAMLARFFRSAKRMRVRITTLHTAMPC